MNMNRYVAAGILLLALSAQALSQTLPSRRAVQKPRLPTLEDIPKTPQPGIDLPETALVLEKAVDPETYIVGPGDRFLVIIPTYAEVGWPARVSAEGKLFIPTLGLFHVAGKPLLQVQEQIKAKARKKYVEGTVRLNLVELRYFRVHVLGEVADPGIYAVQQTYRLSDALDLAGGAGDWANLSRIEIRRDTTTLFVDLTRYHSEGDLRQNPILLDGDVIYVPRVHSAMPIVEVQGRIARPGLYFARPNESASEFLQRIGGATHKANLLGATIKRRLSGQEQMAVIPVFNQDEATANGHDQSLVLQHGDILTIPSITDSVYVQGAVFRPGPYPYYPNFSAQDYAGLAGPTENAAGLKGIRVRHASSGKVEHGPDAPVYPGDTIEVRVSRRILYKDYLQIAATILGQVFTFLTVREALRR